MLAKREPTRQHPRGPRRAGLAPVLTGELGPQGTSGSPGQTSAAQWVTTLRKAERRLLAMKQQLELGFQAHALVIPPALAGPCSVSPCPHWGEKGPLCQGRAGAQRHEVTRQRPVANRGDLPSSSQARNSNYTLILPPSLMSSQRFNEPAVRDGHCSSDLSARRYPKCQM